MPRPVGSKSRDTMKRPLRILGFMALAIVVLAVLGIGFVYSGAYNVAATQGHTKPVEQVLRLLMVRSVSAHARSVAVPADFSAKDRALAEKAVGHFEMMCRTCHGAPGRKPDPWQLYPPTPDLADALRAMRWTDAEVFWIIKYGIKDTGMSAFGGSHTDDDLWALTALIRQLESTTPEQYRAMVERHGVSLAQPREQGHIRHRSLR
ncbi:MAG: c-type cytochrome [Opitutaceae bacterium]